MGAGGFGGASLGIVDDHEGHDHGPEFDDHQFTQFPDLTEFPEIPETLPEGFYYDDNGRLHDDQGHFSGSIDGFNSFDEAAKEVSYELGILGDIFQNLGVTLPESVQAGIDAAQKDFDLRQSLLPGNVSTSDLDLLEELGLLRTGAVPGGRYGSIINGYDLPTSFPAVGDELPPQLSVRAFTPVDDADGSHFPTVAAGGATGGDELAADIREVLGVEDISPAELTAFSSSLGHRAGGNARQLVSFNISEAAPGYVDTNDVRALEDRLNSDEFFT